MADKIHPLQAWREANGGMTQIELGRELGCSGVTILRAERDNPKISDKIALRIYRRTDVRVGRLVDMPDADINALERILTAREKSANDSKSSVAA